jgi:hypothetical protein
MTQILARARTRTSISLYLNLLAVALLRRAKVQGYHLLDLVFVIVVLRLVREPEREQPRRKRMILVLHITTT